MRNFLIKILLVMGLFVGVLNSSIAKNIEKIDVLPTMEFTSSVDNRLWVGTFQLVWNEFSDSVIKNIVKFDDFDSQMLESLNKRNFEKGNISASSYYIKSGEVSPKLKKSIEKGIKKQFKEKSDILNNFDWSKQSGKIFVYSMLKKDFKFIVPFDKLSRGTFGKNPELVQYFGINSSSSEDLYKNVEVLFYNSKNDYAVKLHTKGNDLVLLYRTNDDMTFDKYYSDLIAKTKAYNGLKFFDSDDRLRVPVIDLYQEVSFKELEGHPISGTNLMIDKTIETIDFKMDNTGVKLKSEAALMTKLTALYPSREGRYFMFDDNFVLFLVEKSQTVPYFAIKVSDVAELNKSAKK